MPGKTIFGTDRRDVIDHLDGVTNQGDFIFGYGDDDDLFGLGGDDWLKGGGGADILDGGEGSDTADYGDSWAGVDVNLRYANASGGAAEDDILVSIENLTGSPHRDYFWGNDDANTLNGRGGDDALRGWGGIDTLLGGTGNDRLVDDEGADILNGGDGIDTVDYYFNHGGVVVNLRTGVHGGFAAGDTLIGIENVGGSPWGADILVGDSGPNELNGYGGTDRLEGHGGDDILDGSAGVDTLVGGMHNDTYIVDEASDTITELAGEGMDEVRASRSYTLRAGVDIETFRTTSDIGTAAIDLAGNEIRNVVRGNNGNNVINGGGGNDTLTGLGGEDRFRFDTRLGAGNVDSITDLNVTGNDTIELDDLIFGAFANGPLAEERFVTYRPLQANDNIIYDADGTIYGMGSGALFYDSDGNGTAAAAVRFATLSPGTVVTHDDFLVM